jgi:hypothetical protein
MLGFLQSRIRPAAGVLIDLPILVKLTPDGSWNHRPSRTGKGLSKTNKVQRLKPVIRVRAQHLKAKRTLRHTTVKALLPD